MNDSIHAKIIVPENLEKLLKIWRLQSRNIVFTNGCFDLLHLGHLTYLADAKALGDKLIIGLNADASVSRLKGDYRPINDGYSRAMMLASMQFVDAVILFEEDTPLNLITQISPEILVKGGDYELNQIVGHDVVLKQGGQVKIIPFLEGYSSTKIIARIKGE